MLLACFTMRKIHLNTRMNMLQLQLNQIVQKIQDLSMLGANAMDGIITPDELMTSPASIFMDQLRFSNLAINNAGGRAVANMQLYLGNQAALAQQGIVNTMPTDHNHIFNALLRQELEKFGKYMSKRVSAEENKLQTRKLKIESELKVAQAEYERVEKAEEEGIKRTAPNYA